MDILMRQLVVLDGFCFDDGMAHINPYEFKRYSMILFGIGIFLSLQS